MSPSSFHPFFNIRKKFYFLQATKFIYSLIPCISRRLVTISCTLHDLHSASRHIRNKRCENRGENSVFSVTGVSIPRTARFGLKTNEKTILDKLEEGICICSVAIKSSINFERNNDHSGEEEQNTIAHIAFGHVPILKKIHSAIVSDE